MDEALERVSGAQLGKLMFPQFDSRSERVQLATGMAASPGAAVGVAVFDSATAQRWQAAGTVVARGMGTTCVVGAEAIAVDLEQRAFRVRDRTVAEGEVLAIDGGTGEVFVSDVAAVPSPVVHYLAADEAASQAALDTLLDLR